MRCGAPQMLCTRHHHEKNESFSLQSDEKRTSSSSSSPSASSSSPSSSLSSASSASSAASSSSAPTCFICARYVCLPCGGGGLLWRLESVPTYRSVLSGVLCRARLTPCQPPESGSRRALMTKTPLTLAPAGVELIGAAASRQCSRPEPNSRQCSRPWRAWTPCPG